MSESGYHIIRLVVRPLIWLQFHVRSVSLKPVEEIEMIWKKRFQYEMTCRAHVLAGLPQGQTYRPHYQLYIFSTAWRNFKLFDILFPLCITAKSSDVQSKDFG